MPLIREKPNSNGYHVRVRPKAMTKREGRKLFERKLQGTGLSTEAFIEKWEKGELPDTSEYVRLSMLIPLAR